jgi:hypothetical protein
MFTVLIIYLFINLQKNFLIAPLEAQMGGSTFSQTTPGHWQGLNWYAVGH